jgi:sulfate permease, SulP family
VSRDPEIFVQGEKDAVFSKALGLFSSFVPAVGALRGYNFKVFRRDLIAGITVATVAVPQAMAYASIFGMPVELGLYTAVVMTIVGSLLSASRQLINGPTNVISIAMLSALSIVPVERRVEGAILMSFMIGFIQIGITGLRLGDLSRYISHSVIIGFTVGASVLLILDQLKNALGLTAQGDLHDHFLKRFYLTMTQGGSVHVPTLAVAVGTMAIAIALRAINRKTNWRLPEHFTAVVMAGLAAWYFKLGPDFGVKLVGSIPNSLPSFEIPKIDVALAKELSGSAMAIALLGLLEAIAMSKSLAAANKQKLDINQQCLSEGVANLAGSFFRCFPGSGSLTRSYINKQAGAETQWSGVFCGVFVAITILALAPLAQFIPRAALSGVLFLAAYRMVDFKGLKVDLKATRFDAIIIIATALSAVFVSIEFCILIGVLLSFVIYVPRAAQIHMTDLVLDQNRTIRERMVTDPKCDRLRIYSFEGEMFFGASPEFEKLLEQIEQEIGPNTKALILRLRYARNPDAVCLNLLLHFVEVMKSRGITVLLTGVRGGMVKALTNVGIIELVGQENVFLEEPKLWSSTFEAVSRAYKMIGSDRCATCFETSSVALGAADATPAN